MRNDPPGPGPRAAEPSPSERLLELVESCLERLEREGVAGLDRFCAEHPAQAAAIRERVNLLRDAGLLGSSPAAAEQSFPERLGDFRLLRRLGSGGMGVVYLAVQESLGREVALKLIRPENLYFPGSRERFRREVESVARLAHPGIVPVHLVGEAQGIPFFAMERVRGATLADLLLQVHTRRPADLSGRDFAQAVVSATATQTNAPVVGDGPDFGRSWVAACCHVVRCVAEALEHAHGRGVLHRDLKPSNVMVTPEGRVLLLDFGLASVEGAPRLTRAGGMVGSVPYMAPEQLTDDTAAIGPRTDVYALGVTLYELLGLRGAFAAESLERSRARILEGRPQSLRALNSAVPEDAETVVFKALSREPAQRYPSAGELAHDLQNVLELRPVSARRPGPGQRARLWMRRHPAGATAVLLGILLLVGGPVTVLVQQHLANQRIGAALALAEDNFQKALDAVDQLLGQVGQHTLSDVPQMEPVRARLLANALAFYDGFQRKRPGDLRVARGAAKTAEWLGVVESRLGQLPAAEQHLRRALAADVELARQVPGEPQHRVDQAVTRFALGVLLRTLGRADDAMTEFQKSVELYAALAREQPDVPAHRLGSSKSQTGLGTLYGMAGRGEEAEAAFLAARDQLVPLVEAHPGDADMVSDLAGSWNNLGTQYSMTERPEEAAAAFRKSIELQRRMPAADQRGTSFRHGLAVAWRNLGTVLARTDRREERAGAYREAQRIWRDLVEEFPQRSEFKVEMSLARIGLAEVLDAETTPTPAAAAAELQAAAQTFETLVREQPRVPEHRANLGITRLALARHLSAQGDAASAEVEAALRAALMSLKAAVAEQPHVLNWYLNLGEAAADLAGLLHARGADDEARQLRELEREAARKARPAGG